MVKRENNLLDNSETGWGKHIEIYQGQKTLSFRTEM